MDNTCTPPPPAPSRNLILCFDGTNDLFDDSVTNIVKLYGLLDKQDTSRQVTYYQPGIGTYVTPGFWKDIAAQIAGMADTALATYLDTHIMAGYSFLMNNHRQGDKIFLFGFSRGAYTARCLAGMLHKVGLLTKANYEQLGFAYKTYSDTTEAGVGRSERFKRTFSKVVDIEFLGCWDTVQSVGRLYGRDLPFSNSNKIVKVFRHALALDERRAKFSPDLWHRESTDLKASLRDPNNPCKRADHARTLFHYPERLSLAKFTFGLWGLSRKKISGEPRFEDMAQVEKDRRRKDDRVYERDVETDVLEVWFAGCHADVGGGCEDTSAINPSLSRPSLRWMLCQAIPRGIILRLDKEALATLGLDEDGTPTRGRSTNPSSDEVLAEQPTQPSRPDDNDIELLGGTTTAASNDPPVQQSITPPSDGVPTKQPAQPSGADDDHVELAAGTSPAEDSHPPNQPRKAPPTTSNGQRRTHRSSSLTKTATMTMKRLHKKELENVPDEEVERIVAEAEERNELEDANGPMHDLLHTAWWKWLLLEFVPFKRRYQDGDGCFHSERRWNHCRHRQIFIRNPKREDYIRPNIHYTVTKRADYQIKAKFVYLDERKRKVFCKDPPTRIVYDDN